MGELRDPEGWLVGVPRHLRAVIASGAADCRPPANALVHLLMAAGRDPGLPAALARAAAQASPGSDEQRRLAAMNALMEKHPEAGSLVGWVMEQADHGAKPGEAAATVAHWAGVFDRLAAGAPAAGVALYSLGDEALLAEATAELVGWLDLHGLLGGRVLDLGCGIGRIAEALSPACSAVVGADVSEGMLRAARKRVGAANTLLVRSSGHDLSAFRDGAFDLVIACDVFPYLFQAGEALALDHAREIARVLVPGGQAALFNLTYRGDDEADRRLAARFAREAGLLQAGEGRRPLATWDALVFRWKKPA